jgi:hypothetical protein
MQNQVVKNGQVIHLATEKHLTKWMLLYGNINSKLAMFQHAMFDYRRVKSQKWLKKTSTGSFHMGVPNIGVPPHLPKLDHLVLTHGFGDSRFYETTICGRSNTCFL